MARGRRHDGWLSVAARRDLAGTDIIRFTPPAAARRWVRRLWSILKRIRSRYDEAVRRLVTGRGGACADVSTHSRLMLALRVVSAHSRSGADGALCRSTAGACARSRAIAHQPAGA
jgi:hypothetical protein